MRIRRCITALAGAIALSVLAAMPSLAAGWQLDSTGYWYEREDRSYPADTWEQIGGTWYLFDQDGYMLTGWQQREGVWYYLGTDGAMVSNTAMTIDNVSYTFDSSGAMAAQTAGPPLMVPPLSMNGPISALPCPRDLLIMIPLPCHSPKVRTRSWTCCP